MKLVVVIQEVKFLPGQRLATSPVAKPAGGRRRTSGAGWSKSVGRVLSLESWMKVVVPTGISSGGSPDSQHANADSLGLLERSILPGDKASPVRGHRFLSMKSRINAGLPPWEFTARTKLLPERPVAPPGRSHCVHLNAETMGREGRAG